MTEPCYMRLNAVTKNFTAEGRSVPALENITFDVHRGEMVCIVGPSGCGKSTLLRILAGLELVSSGTCWVDPEQIREGIAFIPQGTALLPWRTLLQNASLGREVRDGSLNCDRLENILDCIKEYKLEGFEDQFPSELSGGMSQKVALICALQSRPRLLLCDEPFSAVDFVSRLELNTLFKNMCHVEGITTVFVTHNIEEAIFLGDRIVVMSGRPGKVVKIHKTDIAITMHDSVHCRELPEFSDLFIEIWGNLRGYHAQSH